MERRTTIQEPIIVSEKVDDFVRRYWPVAIATVGVVSTIGVAVWLTARYLREKKGLDNKIDQALAGLEDEVLCAKDDQALLLESASYLAQISGKEAVEATQELASHVPDAESSEILETIGGIAEINLKSSHEPRVNRRNYNKV